MTGTLKADPDARRNFLASVIACPACGEALGTDDRNRCSSCLAPYNMIDNAFVFVRSEDEYVSRLSTTTPTNPYTTKAKDLIARFKDQWLLDFGSGNPSPEELFANVIRFDVLHYQSVDVVSSYPRLPFQDNTFEHILSESVFEHLSDPFYAAGELWRVLKPGGWILIDTAFLQPFHADPNHYFNMTISGVRRVFQRFDEVEVGVGTHQTPAMTMNVLTQTFADLIKDPESRLRFSEQFAADFAQFDSEMDWSRAHIMAAGVWYAGIKPLPNGKPAKDQGAEAFKRMLHEGGAGVAATTNQRTWVPSGARPLLTTTGSGSCPSKVGRSSGISRVLLQQKAPALADQLRSLRGRGTGAFRELIIEKGFERRGPWVSRFKVGDRYYGSGLSYEADPRIDRFWEALPRARRILELGSLEGGQTFRLASHSPDVHILALEQRHKNVEKARFVAKLLDIHNARFEQANLQDVALEPFGIFDAIFCANVLYHLSMPWALIERMRAVSKKVFIWTHYAREGPGVTELNGIAGSWYEEGDLDHPASGLSSRSYVMTLPALTAVLQASGFGAVRMIDDVPDNQPYPAVTLVAETSSDVRGPQP